MYKREKYKKLNNEALNKILKLAKMSRVDR